MHKVSNATRLARRAALGAVAIFCLLLPAAGAARAPVPAPLPALGAAPGKNGVVVYAQDRSYDGACECLAGATAGIYTINPKTLEQRELILEDPNADSPSFSEDGRTILFATRAAGQRDIFTMSVNGSNLRQLTDDVAREEEPSFLTDGRIGFLRYEGKVKSVVSIAPDGGAEEVIAPTGSGTGSAVPGPDIGSASVSGRYVAYDYCRRKNCDIFLFDNATGKTKRLTTGPRPEYDPEISPDGRRIVFMKFAKPVRGESGLQVWTMRIDGTRPNREGRSGRGIFIGDPTFSPNGKGLLIELFERLPLKQGQIGQLILDPLNGNPARFIRSQGPGVLFDADWQTKPGT